MAYNPVLFDLLEHIGSTSEPVLVNWDSVQQWPSGALEILIQAGILMPASSAQSIVCNACERHCFMDVIVRAGEGDCDNRAFIVCDVPEMQSQIGRVQIPLERLQQWKTDFKQVAGVVAGLLGFDDLSKYKPGQISIRLGMLKSKGGRRWVSLFNQSLVLEVNGVKTSLSDLLFIDDGVIAIDKARIDELVNTKPLSTGKAYVSSTDKREMGKLATQVVYANWNDEYLRLKKDHPTKSDIWYSVQISKLDIAQGRDSETIRHNMK